MAEDSSKSGLAQRMQVRQIQKTMVKSVAGNKNQEKAYAEAIIEYLRDKGQIFCVSDDENIATMLREIITQTLKMPAACLNTSAGPDMLLHSLRQTVSAQKTPLLIIEQNLQNRDMSPILRMLKNGYPELLIISLSRETSKQRYVLMHESGVHNCIIKPIEPQALMEKIALTIKPQGNLGRTLEWARTLMGQGEHLRALQVCKEALDLKANSSAALLLIGDIFRDMQQFDKACEAYENASRSSSMYLEPLCKLEEVYGQTGNKSKRLEVLEKLDELSPLNVERKLAMGELYIQLKRIEKAKKVFEQAMTLSDREAKEHLSGVAFRVADVYMSTDPDTAATYLQRGLEAKRGYWSQEDMITFNRLGILLRRSGKWQQAVEEYNKALQVSPDDANLLYNLGMAYLDGKGYENARKCVVKATVSKPELPQKSSLIACNMAKIYLLADDTMHAVPLLRQVLEKTPDNKQAAELMEEANKKIDQ